MTNSKKLKPQEPGGKWFVPVGIFLMAAISAIVIFAYIKGPKPPLEQSCFSRKGSVLIKRDYYNLCFNKETKQPNFVLQNVYDKQSDKYQKEPIADYYQDYDVPKGSQASEEDYEGSNWAIGNYIFSLSESETSWDGSQDNPGGGLLFSVTSPQNAAFHKGFWKKLRQHVFNLTKNQQEVVVLSGPLFLDDSSSYLEPGHIPVPSHFFQATCPSSNVKNIEVYIVPNKGIDITTPLDSFKVSTKEFEKKSGIKGVETLDRFFPVQAVAPPQ